MLACCVPVQGNEIKSPLLLGRTGNDRISVGSAQRLRCVRQKTWISGQDNSLFGRFWDACHADGTVENLKESAAPCVTKAPIIGVSCVEKDPSNRAFDFLIAAEGAQAEHLESYRVPACTWAIFRNRGTLPMALVDAEMYAFTQWLPKSGYVHAFAPELEVYPEDGSVEFWLPVMEDQK